MKILLWTAIAIAVPVVLYFLVCMLTVGIVFHLLYHRADHTHSRTVLFSDVPEISVERRFIPYGRKKRLAAYLMRAEREKGLVILSHGIRDRGEGYFGTARAFLSRGYAVLLYDAVGSGNSSGNTQRGLPQSAIDLDRVLSYAEKEPSFSGLDFYLYGHSWDGYAVCAVFCLAPHPRVRGVVSLSGFNDPCRMLFESTASASVDFARFVYPPLRLMQFLRFGTGMYRTAEKGIRKAKDTRFYILHSEYDEVIRADGASVYARRAALEGEGARVRFRLLPGRTHLNGWLSERGCERNRVQDTRFHAATDTYGMFVNKRAEEEFYAPIGREERIALSETDDALFDELDAFFESAGRGICPNTIS